ncbi:hypothetical protein NFI96_031382 [Prochilodus magdalenae]|nr:hypothetical protein NFI96_031382 [Prochilodus magdalenae]
MTFDLLTCSSGDTFLLWVPDQAISARIGSSVVLPCGLSTTLDIKSFEISWHRPDKKDTPVLLYKDLKVQENTGDPQYRGRVSLIGELGKGNASLKLENLTLADRGEYVCWVEGSTWYDMASVNLNITVVGSLPLLSFAEAGYQMNVTCASGGWSSKPTLTWRDKGGRELRNSVDNYKTDSEGLVSVSSWLLVPPSKSEWISCSVGLSDQEMKEGRVLPLRPACATAPVPQGWKGFTILLVISLLGFTILAVIIYKTRVQKVRKDPEHSPAVYLEEQKHLLETNTGKEIPDWETMLSCKVLLPLLMTFDLLTCSSGDTFSLWVPDQAISARIGSSVVLPCGLSTTLDIKSFEISWHRPDKKDTPVLLYKDLKVQENTGDPQYRGRVSLIGELGKGNASLKLENLTLADRGEHVCWVEGSTWYDMASVNLNITVVGSLPLLSFAEAGYQMNVTCASGGWSLKPTLTWRAKGGRELRNSVDHYKTEFSETHTGKEIADWAMMLSCKAFIEKTITVSMVMKTALLVLLMLFDLLTCSSGTFSLLVPDPSIPAKIGSSVVLPCGVSTTLDIRSYEVRWHRPNQLNNPVLLYKDLKVQENTGDPQYRGRVSLIGYLEKGNASLKLVNLTIADRGEYVCHVKSTEWYEKASMSLNFIVVGSPPVLSLVEDGEQINVTCTSSGWSPKPTLTWRDKGGRELEDSTVYHKTDSEGLVSVSSWLLVSPSESEWISCSVGLPDQEMKEGRVLPFKPAPTALEPGVSPGWKAFATLLVISLLASSLMLLFLVPKIRGWIIPKIQKATQKDYNELEDPNLSTVTEEKEHLVEESNPPTSLDPAQKETGTSKTTVAVRPDALSTSFLEVGKKQDRVTCKSDVQDKTRLVHVLCEERIRSVMILLLLVFDLLSCANADTFSLVVPDGFISGQLGSSVVLPCTVSPALDCKSYEVSWYGPKDKDNLILVYKELQVQENTGDPLYRNRVSLIGDLEKGNVSLKLENFTLADRGEYVCYVKSSKWHEEASVFLSLPVVGSSPLLSLAEAGEQVNVTCASGGWAPNTTLTWRDKEGRELTNSVAHYRTDSDRLEMKEGRVLPLKPATVPGCRAVIILFVIALLMLVAVTVVIFRIRGRIFPKRSQKESPSTGPLEEEGVCLVDTFSLVVPEGVISGQLGSSVVLPCTASPALDCKSYEVSWYGPKDKDNPILVYKELQVQENTGDPRYRNRVSLIGELEKGDVSLKLENFTLADRGEYVCYVKSYKSHKEASVFLNLPGSDRLVSVSSWLLVSPSESEWISCSVGLSDQEMKEGRVLPLKPATVTGPFKEQESGLVDWKKMLTHKVSIRFHSSHTTLGCWFRERIHSGQYYWEVTGLTDASLYTGIFKNSIYPTSCLFFNGQDPYRTTTEQPQYKPRVRTQPEPYGEDIEGITHCMTDYMNFCMDPWITSSVKGLLNKKKRAFKDNNQEELRSAQRELKVHLREAKESYRRKVEQKLRENNMREVWSGMKTITGYMQRTDSATDAPDTSVSDCLDINTPPSPFVIHAHLTQADSSDNTAPIPSFSHLVSSDLTCSTTEAHTSPLLHTFTADQIRGELRRLHTRKAAGPDRVCLRLLKSCAAELGAPLQHIFNLSLRLGRVPTLWKTSCLVPVPKKARPSELNDFRPVALTSHVMKTLERLLLHLLRPQVQHAMDPLQFAYREKVGVEDAMLYLLHRAHSHLDKGGSAVRVMFFDFSSAFNTIQPLRLKDKLARMQVDPHLVSWITDYLTGRPQYVRLKDCTSETVVSSTGAPQGTVLSPFLFTLYTSDFRHNSETCHMQKFSDDTAIVACVRGGQEVEYRDLVEDFVIWCHRNNLLLNTSKTKEMVVDFRRARPLTQPVFIEGVEAEMVRTYRYLGLHLDERLDWSANTDILYRKGQSRLYFLRRLGSFNICRKLLQMFHQTLVSSCLFYAVVCWGGSETRCVWTSWSGEQDTLHIFQMLKDPLIHTRTHGGFSNVMILLLLFFDLLSCADADTFSLVVPEGVISGQLRSSVVLPCTVSPALDYKTYEIHWYGPKDKENPILLYKDLKVQENTGDPRFRDRVSLIGELGKGDVSLKLEKLTLEDKGEYVCHVESYKWYERASVFLNLPVVGSPPLLSLAEAGDKMNVTCASGGWAPNTTLTWRDKEGRELRNSVKQYNTDSDRLVSVSSWLIVSPSESEWISCSVGLSDQEMKEGRVLPLKPATVTGTCTGWTAFIITLVICLLMLVGMGAFIFRGQIFPKCSQKESPSTGPLEEGVRLVAETKPFAKETCADPKTKAPKPIKRERNPHRETPAGTKPLAKETCADSETKDWKKMITRKVSLKHDSSDSTLGCWFRERIHSGQYYWEVTGLTVASNNTVNLMEINKCPKSWYVGVTNQSAEQKSEVAVTPQNGYWVLQYDEDKGYYVNDPSLTPVLVRVMILLLLVYYLSCANADTFSLLVPDGFISGQLGSSVVLPCTVSPPLDCKTYEIHWYRSKDKDNPILLYKDLKVQENSGDPRYRNRLSLIGELEKGNVSVKLENFTLADRGEYVCHVESYQWYERASVFLNLPVVGSPPLLSFFEAGEQVNVTCASGGWSPNPTLTWRYKGGIELRNSVDHYRTGSDRLVSVSSWLLVSPSESEWISCSVGLSDQEMKEGRVLPLKPTTVPGTCTGWTAFIITLVISLLMLVVMAVFIFRGRIFPKHSQQESPSTGPLEEEGVRLVAAPETINQKRSPDTETPGERETSNLETRADPETEASGTTSIESNAEAEHSVLLLPLSTDWEKMRKRKVSIRFHSSHTTLGCWFRERIHSGQYYWEVTGLTDIPQDTGNLIEINKCPASWYVGVTNQSAEQKSEVPVTPQNGYWVLQYDKDKGYYVNDPSLTPVLVRVMILLLLVADLLSCADADTFSLVVPDGVISRQLGSSVVLPCTVSPPLDCRSYEVSWYGPKDKENPILVYKDLEVQENTGDPRYRNRVSLIGELGKGNVSLKLENLTLADRGEYVCYVNSYKWYEEASVFLNLPVVGSLPLLSFTEAGEQVNVTCASGGWSPNTTLTWRDKGGRELRNSVDQYRTEWISCSVGLSEQEMKEGRVLPLKPATVPGTCTGCTAVNILFVISLLMLVVMAVFIIRIRGRIFPKRSQMESPSTGPLKEEEEEGHLAAPETTNRARSPDKETPVMILLFLVFDLLSCANADTFSLLVPDGFISGRLGSSVVLPCTVSPELDCKTYEIHWYEPKDKENPILTYKDLKVQENTGDPRYRNRVSLIGDLGKGNVSLKLENLTLADRGEYKCYVNSYKWYEEANVFLNLPGRIFPKRSQKKSPSTGPLEEEGRPLVVDAGLSGPRLCGQLQIRLTKKEVQIKKDEVILNLYTFSYAPEAPHEVMILLLLVFDLLSCADADTFSLVVPDGVISGQLGSSVVLPCTVSPPLDCKSYEVSWYGPKDKDNPILLYKDLKVQESTGDPRYRNRVSLIGDLGKGDVSLKLEKLTLADRGEYMCFVNSYKWYEDANVFLNLPVVGSLPVLSFAEAEEQVNVTCASGGWSLNPTLTWRDKEGRELRNSVDQYRTDSDRLVSVSSWLLFFPSESEWISCSVGLSDLEMKEGRVLPLKPATVTSISIGFTAVIIALVISLLLLVVMAVFIFRFRGRIFPKRSQKKSPSTGHLEEEGHPLVAGLKTKEGNPTDKRTTAGLKTKEGNPTDKRTTGTETKEGKPTDKGTTGSGADKDTAGLKTKEGKPTDKGTPGTETNEGNPTDEGITGSGADKDAGTETKEGNPTDKGTTGTETNEGNPTDEGITGTETNEGNPTDEGITAGTETKERNPTDKRITGTETKEGKPTDKGTTGSGADNKDTAGLKTKEGKPTDKGTPGTETNEGNPTDEGITAGTETKERNPTDKGITGTGKKEGNPTDRGTTGEFSPASGSDSGPRETNTTDGAIQSSAGPVPANKETPTSTGTPDTKTKEETPTAGTATGNTGIHTGTGKPGKFSPPSGPDPDLSETHRTDGAVESSAGPGTSIKETPTGTGISASATSSTESNSEAENQVSIKPYSAGFTLGCWFEERIHSGQYYWEVTGLKDVTVNTGIFKRTYKCPTSWYVGVTNQSAERNRKVSVTPQNGYWVLQYDKDKGYYVNDPYLTPVLVRDTFSLVVPDGVLSGQLGSSVVLPCTVSPALDCKTYEIHWYRPHDKDNPILLYKDLKVQENTGDPRYRNRVSLNGELGKGNVSLKLENLTLADRGEYVCYVESFKWYERASVFLNLPEWISCSVGLSDQEMKEGRVLPLKPATVPGFTVVIIALVISLLLLVGMGVFIFRFRGHIFPKRSQKESPSTGPLEEEGVRLVAPKTTNQARSPDKKTQDWKKMLRRKVCIQVQSSDSTLGCWFRERIHSGQYYWAVTGLTEESVNTGLYKTYKCPTSWYVGVSNQSAERRRPFPVTPQNGYWVLQYDKDKGYYVNDPSLTPVLVRGRVSKLGVFIDCGNLFKLDYDVLHLKYERASVEATFSLVVPDGVISGQLGSSVVLPCTVSPAVDCKSYEVRWYGPKDKDNPILLYNDLKIQENTGDPRYRNRVSLIGELGKGNVSLKLENLTLADRGEYMCYVNSYKWYEEANVFLNLPDSEGLVSVSSWLLFSPSESEWISCSVGLSDQEMKEGRVLPLKPDNGVSPGWTAFIILLVISLVMLVVMALFIFKIRADLSPPSGPVCAVREINRTDGATQTSVESKPPPSSDGATQTSAPETANKETSTDPPVESKPPPSSNEATQTSAAPETANKETSTETPVESKPPPNSDGATQNAGTNATGEQGISDVNMEVMILLLLVFDLLSCANADTFSLVVPDGVILGQLGSSVVLPCRVSPALDCKTYKVHWSGPNDTENLILLYNDLKTQEDAGDPRYRNRVSLIGDLEKGNVSLKLDKLTLADRGEYVCFVNSYKWYEEASVFLNLPVVGSLPVLSFAGAGEQVNVTCASGGWSPNPNLTWRDKEGRQLRNSVDHYRADSEGLVSVSSWLLFSPSSKSEWISCSVGLSDQEMKEGRVLPLKPAYKADSGNGSTLEPGVSPGWKAFVILLVISLLLLVVMGVFIFKIRGRIFSKRSQKKSPSTGPLEEEGRPLLGTYRLRVQLPSLCLMPQLMSLRLALHLLSVHLVPQLMPLGLNPNILTHKLRSLGLTPKLLSYQLRSQPLSCKLLSLGMSPKLMPLGMRPKLMPLGMRPKLMPLGMRPKLMPLGMRPKLMPLGLRPKLMPLGLSPKLMPLGVSPKLMPLFLSPKLMPLFLSPKRMPLFLSPKLMPLVLSPKHLSLVLNPKLLSYKHLSLDLSPKLLSLLLSPKPLSLNMIPKLMPLGLSPQLLSLGLSPNILTHKLRSLGLTPKLLSYQLLSQLLSCKLLSLGLSPKLMPLGLSPKLMPLGLSPKLMPLGLSPKLMPLGLSPKLMPLGLSPKLMPLGLRPKLMPLGLRPKLMPLGLRPKLMPLGLRPKLMPLGLRPKLMPLGLRPKLMPLGLRPKLMPLGLRPKLMPLGLRPKLMALGLRPKLMPLGLRPKLMPLGLRPKLMPLGLWPKLMPLGLWPKLMPLGLPKLLSLCLNPKPLSYKLLSLGLTPKLLSYKHLSLGLSSKLLSLCLNPKPLSLKMFPKLMPLGLNPQLLSLGLRPNILTHKLRSLGLTPKLLSYQLLSQLLSCKLLSLGLRAKLIPLGLSPKLMPLGLSPKLMPLGLSPKLMPLGLSP